MIERNISLFVKPQDENLYCTRMSFRETLATRERVKKIPGISIARNIFSEKTRGQKRKIFCSTETKFRIKIDVDKRHSCTSRTYM